MAYVDNTVDHITIGGETKYYEDREARANKAEGKGLTLEVDANYELSAKYKDEDGNEHSASFPGGGEDIGLSVVDGKVCVTFEK